jgi:tRNA(fMet)-specific endonuclease VapC
LRISAAALQKHQAKIHALMKVVGLILPDSATAKHDARISVALEERGRPIPENDLWIAAVALELEMPLVTRDAHFDRIEGLAVIHC